MSYQLRPYQQEASDFALKRLKSDSRPLLMSLSCSFGKSWLIADIAKQWGEKTLVLTLSKELCEQDYAKIDIVMDGQGVGMYSASWGRKETENITVATVQSAYRHPELWEDYSLLILDECDNIVISGMVKGLVPNKHVLGLTATPYSTVGSRCGKWFTTKLWPLHKIKTDLGWFWQPVEYNVSEKDLLKQGYLCPLKIYSSPVSCSLLRTHSNGSEYTRESMDQWTRAIFDRVIQVMIGAERSGLCKSGIVFLPSVESCGLLAEECKKLGISADAVTYDTKAKERDIIVNRHKSGELTWLINQGVATRGFDNPMVDCLVIARPTRSLRLHRQILGRGIRLSPEKKVCNVLDLTNNCRDWGSIEDVVMGKKKQYNREVDTILLRGEDISGTEVSRINLAKKKDKTKLML